MRLNVGELIPLELQLSDGATGKFPRALVYNAAGTLLSTINLTHVASGRYADDSLTMTNTPYTVATYLVYSDSGHTTLDTSYASTIDLWQLATTANSAIAAAVIAATVEGSITVGRALRGLVRTAFAAKRSGYDTGTVIIRDVADTKNSHTIAVTPAGFTSVALTDLD